jgi:hypothetical protein
MDLQHTGKLVGKQQVNLRQHQRGQYLMNAFGGNFGPKSLRSDARVLEGCAQLPWREAYNGAIAIM